MNTPQSEKYEAPRLEVIGTVADLTLGTNGGSADITGKLPGGQVSP